MGRFPCLCFRVKTAIIGSWPIGGELSAFYELHEALETGFLICSVSHFYYITSEQRKFSFQSVCEAFCICMHESFVVLNSNYLFHYTKELRDLKAHFKAATTNRMLLASISNQNYQVASYLNQQNKV